MVKGMLLIYTWPLLGIKYILSRGEGRGRSFSTLISTSICRRPVQDKTSERIHQRGGLVCPWGLHKQRRSVSEELLDNADHSVGPELFRHPETFAVTQRCVRRVQVRVCSGEAPDLQTAESGPRMRSSFLVGHRGELHEGPESEQHEEEFVRRCWRKTGLL